MFRRIRITMKGTRSIASMLVCCVIFATLAGAEAPSVVPLAREQKVDVESKRAWSLPLARKGQQVLLNVTIRRDARQLAGFGFYALFTINGQPLDAQTNRYGSNLINKPAHFIYPRGKRKMFRNPGNGVWQTLFSPDFTTSPARYGLTEKDPYTYVLDVTEFLNDTGMNTFAIANLYTKTAEEKYKTKLPLVVNLDVVMKPADEAAAAMAPAPKLEGAPSVEPLPAGGFAVVCGDTRLPVTSAFSQPGGGWNHLGNVAIASAGKAWKPKWRQVSDTEWRTEADTDEYTLSRVIRKTSNRIQVRDTLTNRTNAPVAVRFDNRLDFRGFTVPVCRMGGQTGQALDDYQSADNATLFYPLTDSGLGMVIEDDVYRNQARMHYDLMTRRTGARSDLFALDAKASYTLEWSLYATPTADYYDFINRARAEMGVNFTIPGPVYFTNYGSIAAMSDEAVRELVGRLNARYIAYWEVRTPDKLPQWGDKQAVGTGVAIFDPVFKAELEKVKTATDRIHRACPGVKVTLYSHCFFHGLEKPDDPTFKDSWIVDRKGQRAISQYNGKTYVFYQSLYPTLSNSYGKAYEKMMDLYFDHFQFDWLYWDESRGPGATAADRESPSGATFNAWDGHTAEIDPKTNRIIRTYALLPLLCDDYIISVVDRVRKRGGFVLFNGAAATIRRATCPAMAETQDHITRAYELHMGSPLAYGFGKPRIEDIRRRLDLGTVYLRTHLDYASKVVTRFFPLTIEELHAGWVKGRERVITNRSGSFGWTGPFKARVWQYDRYGNELNANPPVRAYTDTAEVEAPEDGVAVLERADI